MPFSAFDFPMEPTCLMMATDRRASQRPLRNQTARIKHGCARPKRHQTPANSRHGVHLEYAGGSVRNSAGSPNSKTTSDRQIFITVREKTKDRHLYSKLRRQPPRHQPAAEKKTNPRCENRGRYLHSRQAPRITEVGEDRVQNGPPRLQLNDAPPPATAAHACPRPTSIRSSTTLPWPAEAVPRRSRRSTGRALSCPPPSAGRAPPPPPASAAAAAWEGRRWRG